MRIALIQDQLLTSAGSERVFLYMCQEFPEADIFTLCYNGEATWPEYREFNINVHPLGRVIQNHGVFKLAFPISTWLMQFWDFNDYDVIISSSATTAKYIKRFRGLHICYCYFPTRAIWNFDDYFKDSKGLVGGLLKAAMNMLRARDIAAAQRVDKFIAISEVTRQAITRIYKKDSEVVPAPIQLPGDGLSSLERKNYYLLVSRLEEWKLIDYAIDAFNQLGDELRIIGVGSQEKVLKGKAKPNIKFLGSVSDEELNNAYRETKAVVFTPELEYGLVPLEACSFGTPTIALGKAGVLETMIGTKTGQEAATAVFFNEPTSSELVNAVREFQSMSFDEDVLKAHAKKFGIPTFQERIRRIFEETSAHERSPLALSGETES